MRSQSCDRSDLRSRREGRAAVALVVLMLVLGVAAVSWFLLGPQSPAPTPIGTGDQETSEPGGASVPDSTSVDGSAGAGGAGSPNTAAPAPSDPAPAPVEGRVVDPDGNPIPDASIRILAAMSFEHVQLAYGDEILIVPEEFGGPAEARQRLSESPMVRTDAEGRFSLTRSDTFHSGGSLLVAAVGYRPVLRGNFGLNLQETLDRLTDLEGSTPTSAAETAETSEDITGSLIQTIVLTPSILVTGSVTATHDGRPASGAEVWVVGTESGGILAAFDFLQGGDRGWVDEVGRYTIAIKDTGQFTVGARSGNSDFAPTPRDHWVSLVVERGDDVHTIDLTMDPGGVIEGLVVTASGAAVGSAQLSALADRPITDYASGAAFDNFNPRQAEVEIDGSFRIGGLPLGTAYRVMVEADDYARTNVKTSELTVEASNDYLEIVLEAGSTISGRVETPDGDPASGVSVSVMPDLASLMKEGLGAAMTAGLPPAISAADGSFSLEHVPAGKYRLLAGDVSMDFNPFTAPQGDVHEVDGRTDLEGIVLVADVTLPGVRGDLGGSVTDPDGAPLAGATIRVTEELSVELPLDPSATEPIPDPETVIFTTDASGTFSAPGLAYEGVTVEASLPGHSDGYEILAVGQTEVAFVLTPVGVIRGRVILADGSPPPVPFRVSTEEFGGESSNSFQQQIQRMVSGNLADGVLGESDGTFEIREVPAGATQIIARAAGFAPARSQPIDVSSGAVVEGIELVITRGASILGQVTDPEGLPLAGAKIVYFRSEETSEMDALMAQMMPAIFSQSEGIVSDASGFYRIDHLEPGSYKIHAMHDRFARSSPLEIALRAEEEREAPEISLLEGGIVDGRIVRDGEPVTSMMVQIFSGQTMQQGFSDENGAFRFENLPDGEYAVMIIDAQGMLQPGSGGGMRTRNVEARSGEITELEVVFGNGYAVRGTIENLPERPMNMITLRRPGGPAPEEVDPLDMTAGIEATRFQVGMAMVAADGAFVIEDIEPGEYILEIPAMPDDPTDIQAYQDMDRTPVHRETVRVGESDVTVRVRLR